MRTASLGMIALLCAAAVSGVSRGEESTNSFVIGVTQGR
jgi:hypothetical protein